jgi:O-antigen/teichoic acid export membrane protein
MSRPTLVAEDARELRRGVLVTYLGYALKLGMPVLIALATRAYGVERWGLFVAAQAVALVAARLSLLGLDKSLLWSIASREPSQALVGVRPACMLVALTSTLVSLSLVLAPALLSFEDSARAETLRVVALGIPPFALSEILLHTTLGRRRMELQVAVRETLNPLLQVAAALALFHLGWAERGLAWSFVIAQGVGLAAAWLGFRHIFRGTPRPAREGFAIPRPMLRYAAPLWLADSANSFLLRLDTLALAALTDPATVGIWGVVTQFANALRQIRRAYDPLVTAITARIAVQADSRRLTAAFSYAAQMVALTQLPVFAVLFTFADAILPLYGPGFERGTSALIVLAAFFLLSGGAGLSGLVVNGYGRSSLMLVNVLVNLALQLGLLLWLVPRHGLIGAAVAIGASLCAVNVLQLLEMRAITGSFHYARRTRFSLAVVLGSAAAMATGALSAQGLGLGTWAARALVMLAFVAAYASLCTLGFRRGVLRAPGSSPTILSRGPMKPTLRLKSILALLSPRTRRRRRRALRVQSIAARFVERCGAAVFTGPYAGMAYPTIEAGGSELLPKLLGTYEREIWPLLDHALSRQPERIVNIGCGEGYHAVGLARRLPQLQVVALDAAPEYQRLCAAMAAANGVGERVQVLGACDTTLLGELLTPRSLVLCDCEGHEVDLLDPRLVPGLRNSDILVEVHDGGATGPIHTALHDRFRATHDATHALYRPRDAGQLPPDVAGLLSPADLAFALDEYRSKGVAWLLFAARAH